MRAEDPRLIEARARPIPASAAPRCNAIPVEIRGVLYPSCGAAARALGVTPASIHAARARGTLDRVATGRRGKRPMRVRIAGQVFRDAHAAAAAYGVKVGTVYQALHQGDPDRIARANKKARAHVRKPVTIGALTFPSRRDADRALGFWLGFTAQALRAGDRAQIERLTAAAMALHARRGVAARAGTMKGDRTP